MGLDAFVRCRCLEDGVCELPPVPPERVAVDEDGYLSYRVEWQLDRDGHARFDVWLRSACAHRDMRHCDEYLANWGGYGSFRDQIELLGVERFPVLVAELPEANGGQMPATQARQALDELESFRGLCRSEGTLRTVLLDADSRQEVRESVGPDETIFIHSGSEDLRVGFDSAGLFIRRASTGEELLRGLEVRQRVHPPANQWNSRVTLADARGREVGCSTGVAIDYEFEDGRVVRCRHPARLCVEELPLQPDAFDFIVDPLIRLCRAAIETRHPIVWC